MESNGDVSAVTSEALWSACFFDFGFDNVIVTSFSGLSETWVEDFIRKWSDVDKLIGSFFELESGLDLFFSACMLGKSSLEAQISCSGLLCGIGKVFCSFEAWFSASELINADICIEKSEKVMSSSLSSSSTLKSFSMSLSEVFGAWVWKSCWNCKIVIFWSNPPTVWNQTAANATCASSLSSHSWKPAFLTAFVETSWSGLILKRD